MKPAIKILILLLVLSQVASSQEIFEAIRNGVFSQVKELIEANPQLINARTPRQSTPLLVAVSVNDKPIARYLIEKGSDINSPNEHQWTPLFFAQDTEMAELLLEYGADIDQGAPDYPPVVHLLWSGYPEVTAYLLEMGASVPGAETQYGEVTAVYAIQTGCIPYVQKSLGRVIDHRYETEGGSNLLHYASSGQSVDLVEKLIDAGVSLKKKNVYGLTPLHNAVINGNKEIVRALVNRGSDINCRTADGRTAYNIAADKGNDEVVNCLVSLGADISPQEFPVIAGEYLGQPKPGPKAVPFAPGIISGQRSYHGSVVFSPDGDEIFWSVEIPEEGSNSIFTSKLVDGTWSKPEFFSKGDVPILSPDGKKMYFVTLKANEDTRREIIMARDRTETGWSKPYELPDNINSVPRIHWQVSVDNEGNLYYGANFGAGDRDRVYYAEYQEGTYSDPKPIGGLTDMNAFSPYVSPDGSYLFMSIEAEGERMLLLFRKSDGTWTEPIDIAEYIGREMGYCPVVTPDSGYLFFLSGLEKMYAPYWVDAGFIEQLRPKE
jgi:ankyrin repeat protein